MAKKKNKAHPPSMCYSPMPFTAEENETRFKKDYEFNKAAPVRSPVKGWDYNYSKDHGPPKEVRLIKGTAHRFGGVRSNNSYGKRSAMRRIKI